jgi:hypothetical protein
MRFAFIFLLLPLISLAADPTPIGLNRKSTAGEENLDKSKGPSPSLRDALIAMRSDQADSAEQILVKLHTFSDQNAPEARLLVVSDLINLAFQARSTGDNSASQRAARRALRIVERLEKVWAEQPTKLSELQLFQATLVEEFIGDSAEAENHLLEAARLDASNLRAAEAKNRVERRREREASQKAESAAQVNP